MLGLCVLVAGDSVTLSYRVVAWGLGAWLSHELASCFAVTKVWLEWEAESWPWVF